jgi:hypothetical protein
MSSSSDNTPHILENKFITLTLLGPPKPESFKLTLGEAVLPKN